MDTKGKGTFVESGSKSPMQRAKEKRAGQKAPQYPSNGGSNPMVRQLDKGKAC